MVIFLRIAISMGLVVLVLFGPAGRFDLPFFWAYIAVFLVTTGVVLAVIDRDLLKERVKPGAGGVDRHLRWQAFPLLIAHWVIASLDVGRYHWSDTVPLALQIAGTVLFAAWMLTSVWAMKVNRFFSPVVRIQTERGHHLIDTGPYRMVRHPGYLAALLGFPAGGLMLGSWYSLIPIAGACLLIFRRLIIEDAYLRDHLDGYTEYTQRVRYRLIPGIW